MFFLFWKKKLLSRFYSPWALDRDDLTLVFYIHLLLLGILPNFGLTGLITDIYIYIYIIEAVIIIITIIIIIITNNCYNTSLRIFRWCCLFIIKGFQTIVFIFIVISTTFRPIYPPAFFRCLSNSRTYTEPRTSSFTESTGVVCYNSVSHKRVQVLSIPVLLLAYSQDWTCDLQMIVFLEA